MGEGYDYPEQGPGAGSNPLGVVGFILAFCVSPLGLLISIFALFKAPRGFAVGGVIVGLIGTVLWGIFGFGAWAAGPAMVQYGETIAHIEATRGAIRTYQSAHDGALPENLDALGLEPGTISDAWGTQFRFQRSEDGKSYTLTIAGPDGTFDDGKDVVVAPETQGGEIGNMLGNAYTEELIKRRMGGGAKPNP